MGSPSCPIMKFFNHPRLLITRPYALKIHLTHRSHILPSNCTIPLLMLWRSLTLQALVYDASCLCFFNLLASHIQEFAFASKLHVVTHNTMTSPQTICHAHALSYVPWELWNTKCGCLISCRLVHTTRLLAEQAFTHIGLTMCGWLHWKYHFTWSGACTISVGVRVVFSLSCLLACLFSYMLCLLVFFLAFLFTCFSFIFASTLALLCWLLAHSLVSFIG